MATSLRIPTSTCAIGGAACLVGLLAGALGATAKHHLAKQFLSTGNKKPPGYSIVVTSAPGKMIFISGRGGGTGFPDPSQEHL